jgi:hypothetical protein
MPELIQQAPLINLAAHNMAHVISRSPLIWYPKELVLDVISGRVLVFAHFDLEVFFKMAKHAGFELTFITGKDVEGYMRSMGPMLERPDAYGVNVRFPNGKILGFRPSVFRHVYSHLLHPIEILRLITIVDETQKTVG